MGFPILRLPHVVFRDILKMLEFSEIISISLCSQRCHNATKRNLYKLKEWEICVATYPNPRIYLRRGLEKRVILGVSFGESLSEKQRSGANIKSNRSGSTLFRVKMRPQGYLTSYWKTDRIGIFECGKYVADLFRKEIHTVKFENKSMWLMELPAHVPQKSISRVVFSYVYYRPVDFDALYRVFADCSSEHFEFKGLIQEAPPLIRFGSFCTFYAICGIWMTVRHVTNLKCSHISIQYSSWDSVHANKFLRRWIHRGMPRLENFNISLVYEIDIEKILNGLEQFVLLKTSFRGIGKHNKWCTFYQIRIESKSGSIALVTVNTAEKVFRMTVNK